MHVLVMMRECGFDDDTSVYGVVDETACYSALTVHILTYNTLTCPNKSRMYLSVLYIDRISVVCNGLRIIVVTVLLRPRDSVPAPLRNVHA